MTKQEIIEMLEPFKGSDTIALDGNPHIGEPTVICGGADSMMGYHCCLSVGHSGECYSSSKDVNFNPIVHNTTGGSANND